MMYTFFFSLFSYKAIVFCFLVKILHKYFYFFILTPFFSTEIPCKSFASQRYSEKMFGTSYKGKLIMDDFPKTSLPDGVLSLFFTVTKRTACFSFIRNMFFFIVFVSLSFIEFHKVLLKWLLYSIIEAAWYLQNIFLILKSFLYI